jgi:hypothetical protein
MMFTAVGFDDEAIAHEKVDAAHFRDHHLSPQLDPGSPQSQPDHGLRTRLASGVASLREVQVCKTRRCHNRFRVGHVDHPFIQHRIQYNN